MSGEAAPVFHRLRLAIPILCTVIALMGAWVVPQLRPLAPGLAALGGYGVALARLRHWFLALAAALAPLPGIAWFGASAYAVCLAFAILMAAAYGDALLKEEDRVAALARPLPALAGTLLFALLWSFHVPVQLRSLLAASAATILCLPVLILNIDFDEEDIAGGNRRREAWQRYFVPIARIAEPRWSLALGGVGIVLAILGYFEIAARPSGFDWLAAPAAAVMVFALTRDIYGAMAALAASALLVFFTAGVNGALLLFLLLVLFLAGAAKSWRRQGEEESTAWLRAIEGNGSDVLFAGLAAMMATVPRGGVAAALHAACGLIAALILFPAFAGALRHLFPGHRSVEELYRSSVS